MVVQFFAGRTAAISLVLFVAGVAHAHRLALDVPVGVQPDQLDMYREAKEKGTLLCSSGEIAYRQINDDICDCADGLDEPGSSACANGVFYCHNGGRRSMARLIPSRHVDDGVCDCCDGSDEAYGHSGGLCKDTCEEAYRALAKGRDAKIAVITAALKTQRQGRLKSDDIKKLKEGFRDEADNDKLKWKEISSTITSTEEQERMLPQMQRLKTDFTKHMSLATAEYGPKDAYAPLAGRCFHLVRNEIQYRGGTGNHDGVPDTYRFEVCPFGVATQLPIRPAKPDAPDEPAPSATILGIYSGWNGADDSMTFSEGEQCWQGPARSMVVRVKCGPRDEMVEVLENGKCVYTAVIQTPFACDRSELDHLEIEKETDEEDLEDDETVKHEL